uniref:G-protein coupled receptors family 1 profile domain-containing protein n=1 Tax=Musca domestica TaxID=7370 RepID=A0A1I8MRQ5_MUSDO
VSVDRYWAILYPMAYSRNVRTRTAIVIISMCWLAGAIVGFLPLFGWHAAVDTNQACLFVEVMDYNYLVFLYFATIITPALLMIAFYAHIYKVIIKQVRQIVTMNPMGDTSRRSSTAQIHNNSSINGRGGPCHGGTMLRVLGAARKRDVKATQNLSIIVLFFMICWIPLYTINCIQAFCPTCFIHPKLTLFCIILSHLNSAVNPILYAYHLKDFRLAMKNLILRVMGIEVEVTLDAQHRFSLASQHRLQSMDVSSRNNVQTRIYIDSPIWLRQQQQSLKNSQLVAKCGVVTPCLNNIHQTVAAVASVTTDIERDMWNIREASSTAEAGEINYIFVDDKDSGAPTPPPRRKRKKQQKTEGCESPYSYDNCNYTPSPEEDDFEEVFLPSRPQETPNGGVDHKVLNESLIACAMRDKLRSDIDDRGPSTPHSQSDYEIPKNDRDSSTTSTPLHQLNRGNSLANTPPLTPKQIQELKQKEGLKSSLSNGCLSGNSIYIIDSDSSPNTPGHKPKFRKSAHITRALNKSLTRSCSCTSDTSISLSPQRDMEPPTTTTTTATTKHSDSNNSNNSLNNQHSTSSQQLASNPATGNSHNNNNLNYFTFHHPSADYQYHHSHPHRIRNPQHSHQHHHHHQDKFSPLKAMSNLIFPPIVKHSSLFQLFHPSSAAAAAATSSNTETARPTSPCSTATALMPANNLSSSSAVLNNSESKSSQQETTDNVNRTNICNNPNPRCNDEDISNSFTSLATEVIEVSSIEVPRLPEIRADS